MCKDGLFRSKEDVGKGLGTNMFQNPHSINDKSVAKQMTAVIRESLPEGTQNHTSSKFVR